jgi:hypothetical protein
MSSYQASGDEDPEYTSSVIWALATARGRRPHGVKDDFDPLTRAELDRGDEALRVLFQRAADAEAAADAAEAQHRSLTGRQQIHVGR